MKENEASGVKITFNCRFHGFTILLLLLDFNISGTEFLLESPSWYSKGKLDRAAPLLTPQEGIVYELKEGNRKGKLHLWKNAKNKRYIIKMTDDQGTYIISLQLAQNLFGLFLGLSLLLFNIDDRWWSHARSVSLIFISTWVTQGFI